MPDKPIDLSAGIVKPTVDLSAGLETPEQAGQKAGLSPTGGAVGKYFAGAASEAGLPESQKELRPPLHPKVQEVSDAVKNALAPTGFGWVYSLIGPTLENTIGQAASGNIPGALGALTTDAASFGVPQAIGKLTRVPEMLKSSAARSYGKVLAPTKEVPKAIAQTKVIPGAIERGVAAPTFGGLRNKVAGELETATQALEKGWANLPAGSRVDANPIWDEMQRRIGETFVKGTNVLENPELRSQLQLVQQKLGAMTDANQTVSVESARSWRQLMDKFVSSKPGGFAITKPLAAEAEAKKAATNALRGVINETYPDIGKLNSEYSFWRNFDDILQATSTRRTGQEGGLGRKITIAAGAAAGLPIGPGTAVLDAALMATMDKTFRSTGWRTVSAVLKDRLAEALASGDMAKASVVLRAITAKITNDERQD